MKDDFYKPKWHLIRIKLAPLRAQLRKEKLWFNAEVANVVYDAADYVGIRMLNASVVYVSSMHVAFVLHNHISMPYKNGELEMGRDMLISRMCGAFSGIIHKSITPDDAPVFHFDFEDIENASAHKASNWINKMQNDSNNCARQDFMLKTGKECDDFQFKKIPAIFRNGVCLHKCLETYSTLNVTSVEPHKFAVSQMLHVDRQYRSRLETLV